MRLIVTGYARHGKDTVCEMLRDMYGLKFCSSSLFVAERAVRPWLSARGVFYPSLEIMYADRVNHRSDWYNAISEYCRNDQTRLGREVFDAGNDIYCGLRNVLELKALERAGLFECSVWVDASRRVPPEPGTSISITRDDCHYNLDNNGALADLRERIEDFWKDMKETGA